MRSCHYGRFLHESYRRAFITLTGTLLVFSFAALMTYAMLASSAKGWLKLPHRARFFNRLSGTAFVLLGLGVLRLKNAAS